MNKLLNKIKEIYLSNFEKYFYFGKGVHLIKKFFFYKNFNTKKKKENLVKDKKNLRVGFVTTWNTKCGIAIIPSKYIVEELIRRGIKVTVLSEKTNIITERDENFVRRCWSRNKFDYGPIIEEMKKKKINVVHIEFEASIFLDEYMFIRFLDKLDKMKIRIILSLHVIGRYIDKHLDKVADVVIIHNPKLKKFVKNYKKLENKLYYLNLGVPLIKDEDKKTARKYLKIKSKHVIAYSGFLSGYKNFLDVIKAIKIIKEQIQDILFILASSKHPYYPYNGKDNLYKKFEEIIKDYQLKDNLLLIKKFLSEEEKFRILHAGDILISYNDAFNLSQSGSVKALIASNRPVITSNNIFYADMDKGVVKIENKNPKILAKTIIELFENKKMYRQVRQQGKQFIEENNFEKITDKLIKLYLR